MLNCLFVCLARPGKPAPTPRKDVDIVMIVAWPSPEPKPKPKPSTLDPDDVVVIVGITACRDLCVSLVLSMYIKTKSAPRLHEVLVC